jgi:dihydrofolate reductase
MKVALIAAVGKNLELGRDNQLLWRLHTDMLFFKQTTLQHWVIMGRKSFDSLPAKFRPLPQRTNVVITRDKSYQHDGALVFHSIEEALQSASAAQQARVFIIGGGEIYKQALASDLIDEMLLTHVDAEFTDADVWFPAFDSTGWSTELLQEFEADASNEYSGHIKRYTKLR